MSSLISKELLQCISSFKFRSHGTTNKIFGAWKCSICFTILVSDLLGKGFKVKGNIQLTSHFFSIG